MKRVLGAACWVLGGVFLLTARPPDPLALLGAGCLTAQIPGRAPTPRTPLQQAYDLERRGNFAQAITAYRAILHDTPAQESALLGLERSLSSLERTGEMVPDLEAGLAARPSAVLYGLALRVFAAAGAPDSLRSIADRWSTIETDKQIPYREWGDLLLQRRDFLGARRAYITGRTAAGGDPAVLAPELAAVALFLADFPAAAREWRASQALSPSYREQAVNALVQTPERQRPEVIKALAPEQGGEGAFLAAVLLAQWGDPLRGVGFLQVAAGDAVGGGGSATDLIAAFVAQLRLLGTRDARKALGQALELLATRQPANLAARSRLEAARAYADGGDPPSARRMLTLIAADRTAGTELATQASRTLLDVQIASGELEEAERTLGQQGDLLPTEDRGMLRRRLAEGWLRRGELARAEALATADSSVDGVAVLGRIALFRGDLKGTRTFFQQAGPYAGTRAEATERTAMLALIQTIQSDSLPALGAALLRLQQWDTAGAITGLDHAGEGLPPAKGGASLALLAGELAAARGTAAEAERRLKAVAAMQVEAASPAAELDLARLLVSLGRRAEAVTQLEHLILTYPGSALVPQARRLLDDARAGAQTT